MFSKVAFSRALADHVSFLVSCLDRHWIIVCPKQKLRPFPNGDIW